MNIFLALLAFVGESTGHRSILIAKGSNAEIWCFILCLSAYAVEQTVEFQARA